MMTSGAEELGVVTVNPQPAGTSLILSQQTWAGEREQKAGACALHAEGPSLILGTAR